MKVTSIRDCIVIGAGPSGSISARTMAKAGFDVLVLDSREEVGVPVQCGEAVSQQCLEYSGSGIQGAHLVHRVRGCSIMSPSGGSLLFRSEGWSIDRAVFDRRLLESAVDAGSAFQKKCRVSEARPTEEGFELKADGSLIRARSVILASGASSGLNAMFGLGANETLFHAVNAKVRRRDDSDLLVFQTRSSYQGGYGWYFPRGDEVNVGFIAHNGIKEGLEAIMRSFGIDRSEVISYHGGSVPVGGAVGPVHGKGLFAVGDAGGWSHPISKAGIHSALISGREGALGMIGYLEGNTEALASKAEELKRHPAFDERNLDRASVLSSLSDEQLDAVTRIFGGRAVQDVPKKEIASGALRQGCFRGLLGRLRHLAAGGLLWISYAW